MDLFLHELLPPPQAAAPASASRPPPPAMNKLENGISPSILLIIVILAVIFFVSGLLHLLVRYLMRNQSGDSEDMDNATALQGQLQQLFHLHDAGVDQTFIDSLPVFLYKAIVGVKDPFDCAVCLCEFEADDKLRLLPKCSHAFHLECIDTWLLSHSTCPLCRRSLLPDLSPANSSSPFLFESGSDSSREIASERGDLAGEDDWNDTLQKSVEFTAKEEIFAPELAVAKVVSVKLGKFRSAEAREGGEGTSNGDNSTLDRRRCFSLGSYEYVMDESTLLQVAINPPKKKKPKSTGHRLAFSEYDGHSRREGFRGFDAPRSSIEFIKADASFGSNRLLHKKESFSVSKTWLRSKKQKPNTDDLSRRAFSFRLPLKSSISPVAVHSRLDLDVEAGSCSNGGILTRTDEAPSFARRTLQWISGLHTRVGNNL